MRNISQPNCSMTFTNKPPSTCWCPCPTSRPSSGSCAPCRPSRSPVTGPATPPPNGRTNSDGADAGRSFSSSSVSGNDLTLRAEPVPAQQNGVFFYGPIQTQVPFGNGFRCVGAGGTGIARLAIENSGPAGVLEHCLDNTMPPTAATQITVGSTWNFQAWYRDPAGGGAFFNLSDGLSVTFGP